MLNVIMLNVIMLSVIMLNIIMLSVIILNVIMLNVIMLNVVAFDKHGRHKYSSLFWLTVTGEQEKLTSVGSQCYKTLLL